ncbi:MAG: hypothetical protein AAFQ07_17715 [Chloroflexota bacterium]
MTDTKYVAEEFVAGSPDALVIGQTMTGFLENVQAEVMQPALEKLGIEEIDPEKWYPHQLWLDILKELKTTLGGNAQSAFVAFGRGVVEKAVMPPELATIPDVLNALHAIHHMNLQNVPEDEGYIIEKVDEKHYRVYENTPNPTDGIYGFIWGICARFREQGERFVVEVIDNPNSTQYVGTCFNVTWGK